MEKRAQIHARFADIVSHNGSGLFYLYDEHCDDVATGGLHERVTARPNNRMQRNRRSGRF